MISECEECGGRQWRLVEVVPVRSVLKRGGAWSAAVRLLAGMAGGSGKRVECWQCLGCGQRGYAMDVRGAA